MIRLSHIKKAFGNQLVLDDVSLHVESGKTTFLIGASGAGKSVLVKLLVGLLRPDSGEISLDGEDITHKSESQFYDVRKRCAMVFQHSTLFDAMTCLENVALPMRKHLAISNQEAQERALQLLKSVRMSGFASSFPAQLGDGLKKQIAIARALALKPKYVLFDEPTTSLDPVSARHVDKLIQSLSGVHGVTSLVVSHDLASIFGIADRIVMLYAGKVRQEGTIEDFVNSDDAVVQQFIHGRAEGPIET